MIRMAIQVVFIDDATDRRDVHEIIGIDRDRLCPAGLGLSLAEAKEITAGIQRVLSDVQVAEWGCKLKPAEFPEPCQINGLVDFAFRTNDPVSQSQSFQNWLNRSAERWV
jgi:hypothetical protein